MPPNTHTHTLLRYACGSSGSRTAPPLLGPPPAPSCQYPPHPPAAPPPPPPAQVLTDMGRIRTNSSRPPRREGLIIHSLRGHFASPSRMKEMCQHSAVCAQMWGLIGVSAAYLPASVSSVFLILWYTPSGLRFKAIGHGGGLSWDVVHGLNTTAAVSHKANLMSESVTALVLCPDGGLARNLWISVLFAIGQNDWGRREWGRGGGGRGQRRMRGRNRTGRC